jgi:hypothetical protein
MGGGAGVGVKRYAMDDVVFSSLPPFVTVDLFFWGGPSLYLVSKNTVSTRIFIPS